jgi:protein-disulfide isomerase
MRTIALALAVAVMLPAVTAAEIDPRRIAPIDGVRVAIDLKDAPTLGPADAAITIVEFADFSCEYAARGSRVIRRLVGLYPGKIRLAYKHFPLARRGRVPQAHEAAMAALEQDKFWEMYAALYRRQHHLEPTDLEQYAADLDLDLARFREALANRHGRQAVLHDMLMGKNMSVVASPTYFINGRRVIGMLPLDDFRQLIEEELQWLASGTRREK